MTTSLEQLPPEVLDLIVYHISSLKTLACLTHSSKRLYTYGETHGYRAFVRANFPGFRTSYWKDAARSLTGTTKCWEERCFIARFIEPPRDVWITTEAGEHRSAIDPAARRPERQSIGYAAALACQEEWLGGNWKSRKEFLAIGAGADLRVRMRCLSPESEAAWMTAPARERTRDYDQFHHFQQWNIFRENTHKDGSCDITCVKLGRDHSSPDQRKVFYGRACGALEQITLTTDLEDKQTISRERMKPIRFVDLKPGDESLLLSGQPDEISLLKCHNGDYSPVSSLYFERESRTSTIWSGQFVDESRLVLGRDSKRLPLAVYAVRPERIEEEPIWRAEGCTNFTGVKSISSIQSQEGNGHTRNLLLTAWKWGVVLLHDLRTRDHHVARFADHIDLTCQFYSLLPYGEQRFLAGSNRHGSIKVFDLRSTGQNSYSTISLGQQVCNESMSSKARTTSNRHKDGVTAQGIQPGSSKYDFTLFLRQSIRGQIRGRRRTWVPSRDLKHSSVYSLAAASPFAPSFYVGLEETTVQMDLVSSTNAFPDVVFEAGRADNYSLGNDTEQVRKWLDPFTEQITMGLIEADRPNTMFQRTTLGPWSVVR